MPARRSSRPSRYRSIPARGPVATGSTSASTGATASGSAPLTVAITSRSSRSSSLQPGAPGEVRIAGVPRLTERPSPPRALEARFGASIRLIGYGVEGDLRPGTALTLTLYWAADGPTDRPLAVFTHVLDAAERVRGQH